MTEWVTIKIPEETREKARDDPRTYGDVMESGLEVPSDDLRQYEEFVGTVEQAIHDAMPAVGDAPVVEGEVEFEPFDADVADELAKIREQVERVPDRTADKVGERFG